MRRVEILPNIFTSGCLFSGMMAAFEVFDRGNLWRAGQFVLLAGCLDLLDGLIARLTRSKTAFGMHLDSLADVVAFGAAPALIVYSAIAPTLPVLAKAVCGLYVVCAGLRLARFNVQAEREEKRAFTGLPTPGAGCTAISLFWVLNNYPAAAAWLPPFGLLPIAMVALSYLMVSKFQYFGIKSLNLRRRLPFEILVCIVILLAVLVAVKEQIDLVLAGVMAPYALSGPVIHWLAHRRARPRESATSREASRPADRASVASRGGSIPPGPSAR